MLDYSYGRLISLAISTLSTSSSLLFKREKSKRLSLFSPVTLTLTLPILWTLIQVRYILPLRRL